MEPFLLIGVAAFVTSVIGVTKWIYELYLSKKVSAELREAEREAFIERPEAFGKKFSDLAKSQAGIEEKALEINKLVEESRSSIRMGPLFNLYSKQIEKYQQQTRNRATWSFALALIAMFAGLGFVFWGGSFLLSEAGKEHLAAGASISAIGGGISAFITKTFLDVHKLSLMQLNHYFKQPVINDHILMAQRLADELGDETARKTAYETIINSISRLIDLENTERLALESTKLNKPNAADS